VLSEVILLIQKHWQSLTQMREDIAGLHKLFRRVENLRGNKLKLLMGLL